MVIEAEHSGEQRVEEAREGRGELEEDERADESRYQEYEL